jgi:2-polyprenyl-3-methyl-5-hydroxy-6-metoxy-1,4-benzoquinol methylase
MRAFRPPLQRPKNRRCSGAEHMPEFLFSDLRVYPSERPDVIARLPSGLGRVLDVGCGRGFFGHALVESGKATSVGGVDISPEAIDHAKGKLESAYVIDLDQEHVPFPRASFDTLIYADVLEHLKFPWKVVRSQRTLLKPAGRAYCSVPNVGHSRVLFSLLRQRWDYESEGVFDYTHLRFFTRRSVIAMFTTAGYRDVICSRLERSSLKARTVSVMSFDYLRDFTVRSWWVECSNSCPTS